MTHSRGETNAQPQAVTFDCWQTLLIEEDWKTAHAIRVEALREAAVEAGRTLETSEAGTVFDAAWSRHMELWRQGHATGAREVAIWALEALELADHQTPLAHLVAHFEEASHSGRVTALPGARDTLQALHASGIRCGLVCDTGLTPGRVVRRHLERLGMLDLLESLAFSDEVGVPKPDPLTFRAALEPLSVEPENAVHVGDLRATDVAGGRALGMTTVRIHATHDDRSEGPEADHVVESHAALQALLEVG